VNNIKIVNKKPEYSIDTKYILHVMNGVERIPFTIGAEQKELNITILKRVLQICNSANPELTKKIIIS
jgi:hypothetical protein